MDIKENFSLRDLNTFGIDVQAKYFTEFNSVEQLQKILQHPSFKVNEKLVLGGGSNILFTKNFEGIVLRNKIMEMEVVAEDEYGATVKAGAGEIWHEFVLYCIEKNLGGIENLSLIPGTVGAAPIQNIGAYGVELKDVFVSLEALEIETGNLKKFDLQDCAFGYRDSVFKRELKSKYVITHVIFRLSKNPTFNTSYGAIQTTLDEMGIQELSIKTISDAVIHIRRSKLPDPAVIGNAGSFFKNPEIPEKQFQELKKSYPEIPSYKAAPGKVKVPAGWLNEKCGWKGKVVGQTGVHKNQALVLVNYGEAKGEEIKDLAKAIQESVKEMFGIELETEVNII
ncbi:MAG: UDP-N-acetylmuramate dehydrogenase [Cytophagaceae bacterium]|nr:UDP-N-acetylmuramate dehydrogenase [Cytophagaceae bacterium]